MLDLVALTGGSRLRRKAYSDSESSSVFNLVGLALLQETALDFLDEDLVFADACGIASAVTDAVGEIGCRTVGLSSMIMLVLIVGFTLQVDTVSKRRYERRRSWKKTYGTAWEVLGSSEAGEGEGEEGSGELHFGGCLCMDDDDG